MIIVIVIIIIYNIMHNKSLRQFVCSIVHEWNSVSGVNKDNSQVKYT